MANIQTVIIKGVAPDVIQHLPSVKWYSDNPIKAIDSDDIRIMYGDTIIYTKCATSVLNVLIQQGYNKKDLYWQDLDGYGATKIFQRK